ncbi:hypothetical protein DSCO28_26620 [Desulfosarcina ovata subsp. sediminis]|uniref:CHAT domain-containing protein n=2 Tax=Desulfosarcina ovata TaxID=83564 RepID=A0A5K7ZLU7_9BACT|nr:hypothetical protein DSCO28_26620 [Desulfosarcina ovata subsp. sediminis]
MGVAALGDADPRLAPLHNETAVLLHRLGRHAEAAVHFETALQLKTENYPPDDPQLALAMNNLASVYTDLGRLPAAEALQRKALAIDQQRFGPDSLVVADDLNNLAAILQAREDVVQALGLLHRAITIYETAQSDNHRHLAGLHNNIALLEKLQGRFAPAMDHYTRAVEHMVAVGGDDHLDVAFIRGNLAMLERDSCNAEAAETLFRQAISVYRQQPQARPAEMAGVLNGFASLLRDQNRFSEARTLYREALAIQDRTTGPDHRNRAALSNNLGELELAMGNLAGAESNFSQALKIWQAQEDPPELWIAAVHNNLGLLTARRGNGRKAETHLRGALRLTARLGDDHYQLIDILANLSAVRRDQGDAAESAGLLDRALAIATRVLPPTHPRRIELLNSLAALHVSQKDLSAADRYSRQAAALVRERLRYGPADPRARHLLRHALVNRIDLLQRLADQRPEQAQAFAREAFAVAQWAMASRAGEAFSQLATRFAAGSGELADGVRQRQDLLIQQRHLERMLTQMLMTPDETGAAGHPGVVQSQLDRIAVKLTGITDTLTRTFPDYMALERPTVQTAETVQGLLDPHEGVLLVLTGEHDSFVWLLRGKGIAMARIPPGRVLLSETVTRLKQGLNQADVLFADDLRPFDIKLSNQLYGWLFSSVEASLFDLTRLVTVVDGPLTTLPLSVLVRSVEASTDDGAPDYAQADWLINHLSISRLPSVGTLGMLRRTVAPSAADSVFVGFGDPVLTDVWGKHRGTATRGKNAVRISDVRRLLRLPETAGELRAVAHMVNAGPESLFLGDAATERRVRSMAMNRFRILAFATHALSAEDLPGLHEPALVLTPPRVASENDDGLLTVSEIAGLHLDADLVILSACNSAAPDGSADGEGLSGLARAFIYAGGRSLLVSYWPVSSRATQTLMTRFFEQWQTRQRGDRSQALAGAMRSMMAGSPSAYRHPMFWAPFSVVGISRGMVPATP